jgi:molecular chaperone DnaK (HSP70)
MAAVLATRGTAPHPGTWNVALIDFGAGALDVSILQETRDTVTIQRTAGDTDLGGIDFDACFARLVAVDSLDRRSLFFNSRMARESLSSTEKVIIGDSRTISRREAAAAFSDLYNRVIGVLDSAFEGNPITQRHIQEVMMLGGMSIAPDIVALVRKYFADTTRITVCQKDALVRGAAVQGAVLAGIHSIPVAVKITTPHSLGISLADGSTKVLIPRGTVLPCKHTTKSTTSKDNQKNVGFDVVEGEEARAAKNVKLGNIAVIGIENAPKGVPKIQVTMEINEDGLLVVGAIDLKTGAEITATLQSGANLSKAELDGLAAKQTAEAEVVNKREAWKERVEGLLNLLKAGDSSPEAKKLAVELESWLEAHTNEDQADTFIKKYFEVKTNGKGFV